jgi:hypothetical protein
LLVAPVLLVAVVAVAIAGRTGAPRPVPAAAPPSLAAQVAEASPQASTAATPSPRSDWPAAIGERNRPAVVPREREEGTDGLMGRLPFGLAYDTPYPPAERVNKFTIDDVLTGWSASDDAAPWSRRLGALTNYRTDPYER